MSSPIAGCIYCHRLVSVVDSKYGQPKLRRHKDESRRPCCPGATKSDQSVTHRLRQAAYRQRQLAGS